VKKIKLAVLAAALTASSFTWAQDGKAALVKQFLDLQRPGVEALARALVQQASDPIAQAGSGYLQTQVPAEKREAAAKAADAELKKYFDDAYPIVRDKAVQAAPVTLGPILEQNFNEEELRQLVSWISSPLAKKYQDLNPQMQTALTKKVVEDTRASIEPKIRTLDANVAKALGAPTQAPAGGAPAKAPAKK
jgi:uncharacterized protein